MPFFGIGGDKWQDVRERLTTLSGRAKAIMPAGITVMTGLLMSSNIVEYARYKPYMDYLGTPKRLEEWPKFSDDVVDACALRLLCVATIRTGLVRDGWRVALERSAISAIADMLRLALPLLDRLNTELVQNEYWGIIRANKVGDLLSTFAHEQQDYNVLWGNTEVPVPGGIVAAQARGLYAHGAAALSAGDQNQAHYAWSLCGIYCKSANDPAVEMSRVALARLKA